MALAVLAGVCLTACSTSTKVAAVASTTTAAAPSSTSSSSSSTATTAAPTTTTTAATTTTAPKGGRKNPAGIGETLTLKDRDNGAFDVTITSFVADGNDAVFAENQYNQPPKPGFRYSLVGVAATYHAGQTKTTGQFGTEVTLSVFGQSAKEIASYNCPILIPDNLDSFADLLDGWTTAGNLCFLVSDADAAGPLLLRVSEALCFSNCDEGWVQLQ
jgi:hypothetical protein